MSPEVTEVLKALDLGQGAIYSTSFFKKDQTTSLNLHHNYLNIGNVKDTFLAEQSPRHQRNQVHLGLGQKKIDVELDACLAKWAYDDVAITGPRALTVLISLVEQCIQRCLLRKRTDLLRHFSERVLLKTST